MNTPHYRDISSNAKKVERVIHPIYRLFDRLFSPQFNPLYRAGTMAALMLVALIASGLLLVCFYSVSQPYESIEALQAQPYFGRWLRAFHRYATVAAMVFAGLHFVQMMLQSKSRGPWILAWVSGVFLVAFLLISGWTGYVMVWDSFAQRLAISGAELLSIIPFLREPLSQAFDGSTPVGAAFFFMNLFLHVALPLIVFITLWIHLARLSRAVWFPARTLMYSTLAILLVVSLLWAAPLPPKADLLQSVGRVPGDIIYGFWMPLAPYVDPWLIVASILIVCGFVISFPWWWDTTKYPISKVDNNKCTGCTQCARDCPYDAISMIPRDDGRRLLAAVDQRLCVSCGICAASCDDLAIGPDYRDGQEQIARLEEFWQDQSRQYTESVVVCRHVYSGSDNWKKFQSEHQGVIVYPVDCCGALHRDVLTGLLARVERVFVHACPTGNCLNRDAYSLFSERLERKRVPFLPKNLDMTRIRVASGDFSEVIGGYIAHMRGDEPTTDSVFVRLGRVALALVFCFGIAALSRVTWGEQVSDAALRVSARLTGITKQHCRALTDSEKASIPLHMQRKEICETQAISYQSVIELDGSKVFEQIHEHQGVRGDSPLYISDELSIPAGRHRIRVTLQPKDGSLAALGYEGDYDFKAGRFLLLKYNPATSKLEAAE